MKKNIFFFSIFLLTIIFYSCSYDTMWTGREYFGSVTLTDPKNANDEYYEEFRIFWSGNWTFIIESLDEVKILIELDRISSDDNDETNYIDLLDTSTSDKKTFTIKLFASTRIRIKVDKDEPTWDNNNFEADFKIKATLF